MPSTHAFSEKVALVTAGTTPVGRAVAMQLALFGAFVVIAHPENDPAVSDIEELKALGTLAASAPFSKYGSEGAKEITRCVDELYGRLDLLVNCATVPGTSGFQATSESRFEEVSEILLESTFFITKESVRLMSDRPKPKIVNVFWACDGDESKSDVAARVVNAAMEEFTKALTEDLPGKFRINGVRVSDAGDADRRTEDLDPELFRRGKGVDPDDVARSVLFLLSSEATGLAGEILNITQ